MQPRENSSSRHSWLKVASTIVMIMAIWVGRGMALERPVTVDESKWAVRAANFFSALKQRDFASAFQKEHPGVTTMWVGTAGLLWRFPDYSPGNGGQVSIRKYHRILKEHGHTILEMLTAGRFFMVLANTIVLALAFIFAQRLLGLIPAFIGFLLIAFDPFHVAHSRLLHLDGLLSSLMLLALLAFLSFGQKRRVPALIASGVAAGLSWLTKSPALFLVPTVVLLSALDALNNRSLRSFTRLPALVWQFAWPLILWGLVATAVYVALWPAMWVDPLGTLSGVLAPTLSHAAEGHLYPMFFNGQVYADGQIDTPIFYPMSYLWRSTPVVLVGILFAAIGFVSRREPLKDPETRRAVFGLVLFVVVFTTLQNIGAKKFDRYLLPVFLPLDLIAAVGWVMMARWLTSGRITRVRRLAVSLLLGVVVIVQAVGMFWTFPYYLSYYNPLLGGSRKAQEVMMIGWGEGLDQAADYLNDQPNAQNLRVLAWYPQSFDPYFVGTTGHIVQQLDITEAQLEEMLEWHYAVIYIHQWQRQMPTQLLDHLAQQTPVHSIWINGLEYARVYKLTSLPEPPVSSKLVTEANLGDDPYQLVVPSNLPSGEYELLAGMHLLPTGEGLPPLATDGQVLGDSISPGQVMVAH